MHNLAVLSEKERQRIQIELRSALLIHDRNRGVLANHQIQTKLDQISCDFERDCMRIALNRYDNMNFYTRMRKY